MRLSLASMLMHTRGSTHVYTHTIKRKKMGRLKQNMVRSLLVFQTLLAEYCLLKIPESASYP